jgi:hypothetical protein
MRQLKLISGKMNIPYKICKIGYAIGVKKPKRVKKIVETPIFNGVTIQLKKWK